MRLLITGASSYLGRFVTPLAAQNHAVYATYHHTPCHFSGVANIPLDVRDGSAVSRLVADLQPQAILHLAGSNRGADMSAVIVQGAEHLSTAAQQVGARLLYFSTDVLYDGRYAPYHESDKPTPIHDYGRAKATAERIIATRVANHVILRPSLIYSLHHMDHGTAWVVQSLRRGEPVTLFTNQWRMPVTAETLSMACMELLRHTFRGILHVAGRQTLSRAEFGLRMLAWWGIPDSEREGLTLAPAPPHAPWPTDTRLDIGRASLLLHTPLLGVDEVLAKGGQSER